MFKTPPLPPPPAAATAVGYNLQLCLRAEGKLIIAMYALSIPDKKIREEGESRILSPSLHPSYLFSMNAVTGCIISSTYARSNNYGRTICMIHFDDGKIVGMRQFSMNAIQQMILLPCWVFSNDCSAQLECVCAPTITNRSSNTKQSLTVLVKCVLFHLFSSLWQEV